MKRAFQAIIMLGAATAATGFLRPVVKRTCAPRCAPPVPLPLLPLAVLHKKKVKSLKAKRAKRQAAFATKVVAPLAPVAAFYGVMGAPIYGKGLGFGTGGLLDFETLEKRLTTNEYLAAPDGYCAKFDAGRDNKGGGGGAAVGAPPPVYDVSADQLVEIFREMVTDLYTVKQYALPTLSKQEERRYVFVQRTPLLRFPDVINVQFLPVEEGESTTRKATLAIHSGSVYGADDLGKNRERVVDWLARLDDAVAAFLRKSPSEVTPSATNQEEQQEEQQSAEEEVPVPTVEGGGVEESAVAEEALEGEMESDKDVNDEPDGEGKAEEEEAEKEATVVEEEIAAENEASEQDKEEGKKVADEETTEENP